MTVTVKITAETEFHFKAMFYKGNENLGSYHVPKPTANCAEGWMDRGHAKNRNEAVTVARRWAGY